MMKESNISLFLLFLHAVLHSVISSTQPNNGVGTPTYTAPEILRNEPFSEKADIYSLALVRQERRKEDEKIDKRNSEIVVSVCLCIHF